MLTALKRFTRLIWLGLLLVMISGCAGRSMQSGTVYDESDKYYRDAADQWVDYGF